MVTSILQPRVGFFSFKPHTHTTTHRSPSQRIFTSNTTNTHYLAHNMSPIMYVHLLSSLFSPGMCSKLSGSRAKTITIKGGLARLHLARALSFLSDIELRTRARRQLPPARQFDVQLSIGDTARSTNVAKEEKNRTIWPENLSLWVHIHCLSPRD